MPTHLRDPKDPNDTDDFVWEWAARLTTGETISTFVATVVTGAWLVTSSSISGTRTTARMTGGAVDTKVSVLGRITTSAGRQLDWTLSVNVKEQ